MLQLRAQCSLCGHRSGDSDRCGDRKGVHKLLELCGALDLEDDRDLDVEVAALLCSFVAGIHDLDIEVLALLCPFARRSVAVVGHDCGEGGAG